jgi:hypothetical protein
VIAPGLVVRFADCSPMQPGLVVRFADCSPMQPGLVVRFADCSPMHPGDHVKQLAVLTFFALTMAAGSLLFFKTPLFTVETVVPVSF